MSITAAVRSPSSATLRMEVDVDGRHVLATDEPPHLGGDDTAPTPYELLAAALAACVVTTIRMYVRRKGWELGPIEVDAVFNGDATEPACTYEVRFPADLDPERRARLERVAQACAVHRTLERGVAFEHVFTTADAVGAAV